MIEEHLDRLSQIGHYDTSNYNGSAGCSMHSAAGSNDMLNPS